ncbi:hypothetical protein C3492_37270 [Streptomyces sp. Ru62]|uniref:hypothetical protein n=1 Tax=Streptomyces sp. Ru62 TaxID=2080745 RepID=UPI000CDD01E3|nr:hypothetical protein [Streptomyces sp. Ru62]POX58537.1 hypothetical protein C3492_37270 [Streptomyces sp. Ru62]
MHRTTTTAALLVTVAVSALSGCVTVRHATPTGSPPDSAPSRPTVTRPDGSAEPRVVQAPAREALERTGPSRRPERSGPPARHRAPAAPGITHRPPAPPGPPLPAPSRRPHSPVPLPPPAVTGPLDVCALGKTYGGWQQDSPQARICAQAYGH